MSFRKRNTVLSVASSSQPSSQPSQTEPQLGPGVRPSCLDGRPTTSSGTASLDSLLAGHAGIPLGTSLLVEEQGTTDFSGVILKYFAAEGLVQGHHVHVLGHGNGWKRDLPAVSSTSGTGSSGKSPAQTEDKLKIAWRYEALGNRGASNTPSSQTKAATAPTFCHSFDLTKRLSEASAQGILHATPTSNPLTLVVAPADEESILKRFIRDLNAKLTSSPPTSIHRVVVPTLLSPMLYSGGGSSQPSEVLQFLHALRGLLRQYSGQLTAIISLQTALFARTSGLTRWMELLCDGVIELVPLSTSPGSQAAPTSGKEDVDRVQGFVQVYTLPTYHEKGGGGAAAASFRENLAFSLSSSRGLVIKPYSLPPLEDEGSKEKSPADVVKDNLEF